LLADVYVDKDNCSNLKRETVLAFIRLPFTEVLTEQVITAGRLVLPAGAADDASDRDFADFQNENLTLVVRLFGLLKLILANFGQVNGQPTLLLLAREFRDQLAAASPMKTALERWIQRAEEELGLASVRETSSRSMGRRNRAVLEASLMITVRRYSKQTQGQPLQYQVDACLDFGQITGATGPRLIDKPPLSLALPEAQDRLGIVCPWKQVPQRAEQFLAAATDLLGHSLKQELDYGSYQLTIELFLPVDFLGEAVDCWPRTSGRNTLGYDYGVIVRFVDRIDDDERYNEVCLTWDKLQELLQSPEGIAALPQHIEVPTDFKDYASWRQLEAKLKQKLGLKLCCGLPTSEDDQKGLFEAILYGDIPVAVWTRSADVVDSETNPPAPLNLSQALTPYLMGECFRHPTVLGERLKHVRQQAVSEVSDVRQGRCLGNHIAFLLDNPDRLPILPPLAS
ncbi:MAG: hypothetical protein AAFN08_18400, partial [Cyanobacteria bacterium J06559_3]